MGNKLEVGKGIRVCKNTLLDPNEVILVVGVEAYERIKDSNTEIILAAEEETKDGE